MAPSASQSYGRTTGDNRRYWWDVNKRQIDGEEARGGEIDARAGKVVVDMELGRGYLIGGIKGRTDPSVDGKSSK